MSRDQLLLLLDYIDTAVESAWNDGPYASKRLEEKMKLLKSKLLFPTENKTTKEQ